MISLGNFGYQQFLLGNCSWISLVSVGYFVGGFKHFLFSIIIWDNPSHWLIFFRGLKHQPVFVYWGIPLFFFGGDNHPNWTFIFFRGVGQPPTGIFCCPSGLTWLNYMAPLGIGQSGPMSRKKQVPEMGWSIWWERGRSHVCWDINICIFIYTNI